MKAMNNYLYAKDSESLQIPYAQYEELMETLKEAQRLQHVKAEVLLDLRRFLDPGSVADPVEMPEPVAEPETEPTPAKVKEPEPEKVSIEFSAGESESGTQQAPAKGREDAVQVPPVKEEIARHFNKLDESGRLFNVFTQYYTCLNDACGGPVRVTMKDGFCSLWNYDEWEEFAFVDIFEGLLRMTIDPHYTDVLESLSLCETPRLISTRRNVVSVQVGDLNNVLLDVLAKAFSEVGMQKK